MDKYQILTLNQIAPATGCTAFPAARYTVGKAIAEPDAILVRSHDMHAMPIPRERQGDRPRRRGHQQHSGRCAVAARRPGVQRAGRQRQCGQGAGAGRAADRRAQRDSGAALRRRRSTPRRRISSARSRRARSSSPASSCRNARSASSAWARSAACVADIAIKLGMKVIGLRPGDHRRRRMAAARRACAGATASRSCSSNRTS